jgi:hypothetical protein
MLCVLGLQILYELCDSQPVTIKCDCLQSLYFSELAVFSVCVGVFEMKYLDCLTEVISSTPSVDGIVCFFPRPMGRTGAYGCYVTSNSVSCNRLCPDLPVYF